MKKVSLLLMLFCLGFMSAQAQMASDVVKWTSKISDVDANNVATITFHAALKTGWHVYDQDLPEGGPNATEFDFETLQGAVLVGKAIPNIKPKEIFDKNFEMNIRWFEKDVTFSQKVKLEDANNYNIAGDILFMACNDETCLSPDRVAFSFQKSGKGSPASSATANAGMADETASTDAQSLKETTAENSVSSANAVGSAVLGSKEQLWQPVIQELKSFGDKPLAQSENASLWKIFIFGFLGGLVALLTPCVWPMIPMTVSFFLKRTKNRKKAIKDALSYGVSIIVIYLALGLAITSIFGANALNNLSTTAVFNIIFFLLLVVFAVSFFGAFEITLPQSWTNKMDAKADKTTGLISIMFMAFTLALVSFSCTGPIIGTLLVQAATMGNILGPAVGMFGFSFALAIPFALFAIFPNMLQSMPKSGGWLNSVKVVLGFLELALAFKFLSVADLAYGWHILDRETFVALWIVIFALLGLYLLGKLRLPHDSERKHTSVLGLFLGIVSLAFAVYMLPGLWGAPLKSISAFAPPLYTQDFNLYDDEVHAQFDDYELGMAYAAQHNKPVLVDFSGYGCVNCRKMEAAVWTNPRVKQIIENDFVLISLMVDDKAKLPEPIQVEENGKTRTLKSIGDKWSYLQRTKFGINGQPYYIMLNHQGKPLGPSYGFDENVDKYIAFLQAGIKAYKSETK